MKVSCFEVEILLHLLLLTDLWDLCFFCFIRLLVDPHDFWLLKLVNWLSDYVYFDLLLFLVIVIFVRTANSRVAPFWMMLLHVVVYVLMSVVFFVEVLLDSHFEAVSLQINFVN